MSIPFKFITLDKPRKIKFGFGALMLAQTLTGKKTLEIISTAAMIDVDLLSKLLYAGLQHEDKELTIQKVIDLVDEHADSVYEVMNVTIEALCESVGVDTKPSPQEAQEESDPNVQGPTATQEVPGT